MENSRLKKLIIIFFLGFSCGLPLPLIMSTLQALLFENGVGLKFIGLFSLVTIVYNLKIFFAPIIDSLPVPYLTTKFGQRRSWIILSQIFLMIFIAAIGIAVGSHNIKLIAILAFLVAFFSASQDLVVDAYRIELIKKEDQGFAATSYIYGYRIAIIFGGAGALILSTFYSWSTTYLIMSCAILVGIVTILFASETRKNWVAKSHDFISWFKNSIIAPLQDLTSHSKWYLILILIICYKLSDSFAGSMTMSFLLDLKFSKIEIASIVKTFGLLSTLLGALIGGILVKKIGLNQAVWIALLMQIISNLGFCYQAIVGHDVNSLYLVIFAENFSGGIGDAVLVTYLSGLCNIIFSATQYSLLMSLASLGRSLFASSAGIVASKIGWVYFFIFSMTLSIPALLALIFLTKKQRDLA